MNFFYNIFVYLKYINMFVKKNMKNLFKKQRIVQDVQVQDVQVEVDVLHKITR